MTDTQHTDAPWKCEDHLGCKTIKGNKAGEHRQAQYQTEVATTSGLHDNDEDLANARLIAAAPDLLKRLKDARKALDSLREDALGKHRDVGYPYLMELKDKIDDAIRKADP